jgi:hypothetical protein
MWKVSGMITNTKAIFLVVKSRAHGAQMECHFRECWEFCNKLELMNENSSELEGYLETETENCSWTKPLLENEFASQVRWVLETTSITYIISKSDWLSFMESSGTYIWMRFVRCWAISSGSDPCSWGFLDKFLWPFMNGEGRVVHELD